MNVAVVSKIIIVSFQTAQVGRGFVVVVACGDAFFPNLKNYLVARLQMLQSIRKRVNQSSLRNALDLDWELSAIAGLGQFHHHQRPM